MTVSNGQIANEDTFNEAFVSRISDTNTVGKLDLENADAESGDSVFNTQKNINGEVSFSGRTLNGDADELPAWVSEDVGTVSDNLKMRADALSSKFNETTGHAHAGGAGDGTPIDAISIINTRLKGSFVRGINLSAITGDNVDVSTQMASKTASTGETSKGVVVTPGYNQVILKDNATATKGDQFKDALGNIIFGRITEALGVWVLSFFSDVEGVETAFSFTSQNIAWYFQELFNPITDAPVYSEITSVPSDNLTQDIVQATDSIYGKVILSASAPADIGETADEGTANGIVANANHVHEGVHGVFLTGDDKALGDVELEGTGAVSITRDANKFTFSAPPLNKFIDEIAFDGEQTSEAVDVSDDIEDARNAIWQLSNNSNDFEILGVVIKKSETTVTIECEEPLAAGNYRLIGVEIP